MYILKPEMAEGLRSNNFEIITDAPKSLENEPFIATIGDICTLKIIQQIRVPDLCIVDYKTKRDTNLSNDQKENIDSINSKSVTVKNPAGTITEELWNAIEEALNNGNNTKIIVDGEEDLATLAVISLSKIGAKVIYGMPDKGMVVVDVNQQAKKRANDFLNRMLVK
ncbi:MAG: GTP-dependent dephospho-CoA kinase family protein [Candidatus Poseidoniales archaeon]